MIAKTLTHYSRRPLALLSAALAIQAAGALITARAADAQTQARELLSPSRVERSVGAQANPAVDVGTSLAGLDPQGQARQVLVGRPRAAGEAKRATRRFAEVSPAADAGGALSRHAHADAQEMARRMILGTAI